MATTPTPAAPPTPEPMPPPAAGTRIALAPSDYWELRARVRDTEAVELDLLKQRLEGERRLKEANAAARMLIDKLRATYPLPDRFGWDDTTREVIAIATNEGEPRP